jgi:ribosome biogenesis protein SSF1/2
MLNNLFPSLDLGIMRPSNVKRVVLVNFDATRDILEWRHYYVKQQSADLNNKLRKMVSNKRLPNLAEVKDLSQYFAGNVGYVSESDVDNLPNSKLQVEESSKQGKVTKKKVSLRLFEIGPRMTLKLVKIEEGFLGGEVFYHRYRKKTHKEKAAAKNLLESKAKLKEERKQLQEANVSAKSAKIEAMEAKLSTRSKRKELLAKRDALTPEGEEPKEGEEQADEQYSIDTESEGEAHHEEGGDLEDVDYVDEDQAQDDEEHLEGEEGESGDYEDIEEDDGEEGEEMDEEYIQKFETNFV